MIPESIVLGEVLAPIVSAVVVVVLYHYIGREYLGADENRYWNALRRTVLKSGDNYVRENTDFGLTNSVSQAEFVGTYEMTSSELAHTLESEGYVQCVLSGLKYDDEDRLESGSMALREAKSDLLPDALALRQNHVFWFENEDGSVDVYAHYEYSSLNPLVSWKHYRAVGQDATRGVANARKVLE
jgi:hypothetical protein